MLHWNHLSVSTAILHLDFHSTTRTVHSAHLINEKYLEFPKRDEFKTSSISHIVAGAAFSASRTNTSTPFSGMNFDFDARFPVPLAYVRFSINKPLEFLNVIQDSLYEHLVFLSLMVGFGLLPILF